MKYHDLHKKGDEFWFEYHCNESYSSEHAEWWYRSHQKVTILKCNNKEDAVYPLDDRYEDGILLGYDVKFKDGFVGEVMEDELLKSKAEFTRPDPPKRKKGR